MTVSSVSSPPMLKKKVISNNNNSFYIWCIVVYICNHPLTSKTLLCIQSVTAVGSLLLHQIQSACRKHFFCIYSFVPIWTDFFHIKFTVIESPKAAITLMSAGRNLWADVGTESDGAMLVHEKSLPQCWTTKRIYYLMTDRFTCTNRC